MMTLLLLLVSLLLRSSPSVAHDELDLHEVQGHHHHHHHHHHHDGGMSSASCAGAGLPEDVDPVKVMYKETPEKAAGRRMASTSPRAIRISMQYGALDDKLDAFTCTKVGQLVDPCKGRWSYNSCASKKCTEKDVVDDAKRAIGKKRMEWAANYVTTIINVKNPREDNINTGAMSISLGYKNYLPPTNSFDVANTDLIILGYLRKHENDYVAGYAGCMAAGSDSRCIVGYFNYCPRIFDVTTSNSPDVIEKERRTAVHEILHVLGAVKLSNFINGGYLSQSDTTWKALDNVKLGKKVIHVRTPKVLEVWRAQTGCKEDEDHGPTIEDLPLGVGSHWEARQTGSIVMSYGTLSSEVYLSDLTLAFLEDTGHYVANYSNAGRLVQPSTNTITDETSFFATTTEVSDDMLTKNKKEYSPGSLRWGRGEKCSFYSDKPSDWPKKYVCEKDKIGGCTPDNRMAAICRLVEYGPNGLPVPVYSKSAKLTSSVNAEAYSDTCWREGAKTFCKKSVGGYPTIPEKLRPAGKNSGTIGGWNSAMDFAAVPAGYWNCQDQQPASSSSNFAEGGNAGFNMGDIVSTNMKAILKYGGQTRCPSCRCFASSLREFNLGIDVSSLQNSLGLCYRANCPTPNHLQIGIKGMFGTYWYDCPDGGGDLNIAGFSGSITCPNASLFCQFETPTGMFNPATSPISEWIFLACIIIVPLTLFLTCKCHSTLWPKTKEYLEAHHGIGDLHAMWGIVLNDIGLAELTSHNKTLFKIGLYVLLTMSMVEFIIGLFTMFMGFWLVRLSVFALGMFLVFVSWAGVQGGRHARPSAHLIHFVYGNMTVSTFSWLYGMGAFLYPEIMREYVLTFGDTLFPDDIDQRIHILGVLLLVLFAIQMFGMGAGMIILSPRVVAHANLILVNILGFILSIIGSATLGPEANLFQFWYYVVLAVVPGVLIGLHSFWGTYAVRYKSIFALNIYKNMSFFCLAVLGLDAFCCFSLAGSDFNYISESASEKDIHLLTLSIYKASDKCPSYRVSCRVAIAHRAYSMLITCGMFAIMNACLLALCAFAAWNLRNEKTLIEELLDDLTTHPSHKNVQAFILAKQLVEHQSLDKMAFADGDGRASSIKRQDFAKARLKSMFRGYRLKKKSDNNVKTTSQEPMEIA